MRTILVHIQPTYIFRESIDANRKILKGSTKLVFLLMSLLEMKVKLNQGKISANNQISGFILYLLLISITVYDNTNSDSHKFCNKGFLWKLESFKIYWVIYKTKYSKEWTKWNLWKTALKNFAWSILEYFVPYAVKVKAVKDQSSIFYFFFYCHYRY